MTTEDFQKDFNEVIDGLTAELGRATESLEEVSDALQSVSIYDDVNKYKLAKLYGSAIDVYNRLCSQLSRCAQISMMLRRLRKQIANAPVTIAGTCRARLESLYGDIESLRDAIVPLKVGYETQIKYFNSCQWMLTADEYANKS